MTPRFYWFLWSIYFVSAAILWLGNVFTMFALVVYGFVAFGLIFAGMMCVLPGVTAKPKRQAVQSLVKERHELTYTPASKRALARTGNMQLQQSLRPH